MPTSISLLAPNAAAYVSFTCRSGNVYTSNALGQITGVGNGDLNDLEAVGCLPLSASIVNITTATYTLTASTNANGVLTTVNAAAGSTITLPAATGTGNRYELLVGTTITSNNLIVQVANSTDIIQGIAIQGGATGATTTFVAGATDDTITLNGSTKGGFKGDIVEIVDAASGVFSLQVRSKITGTAATPFSSAV